MILTKTAKDTQLWKHKIKGIIKGEYFFYDSEVEDPDTFLISNAALYINPTGNKMSGYFIANGNLSNKNKNKLETGDLIPDSTWVGMTLAKKK